MAWIMELILFYNLSGEKGQALKMLCTECGILFRDVLPIHYGLPLGDVLSGAVAGQGAFVPPFSDEMMVFAGMTGERLFSFLDRASKRGIPPVALKATVTENNLKWNSLELRNELEAEHRMMSGNK